ncbi:metallophosphoesterase 1 [Microplitis mediator]|uniref:metallophosphoesterase 1 n=1 Tax=Microplitis mediator TaxID=375433 RepID=UPI002553F37A|nr:metallophosphoesterase 1 [Microplitis mediator]
MLGTNRRSYKYYLLQAFIAGICLLVYCEYLNYYVVLAQCSWPDLDVSKADPTIKPSRPDEKPVKIIFIADTHLLGSINGHWFDKLRREWQMHRTFQTSMVLHKPDIVFFLGDIFDEGLRSSPDQFETYVNRFHSLFAVPKNTYSYVLAGNHDMGFHYAITPYTNQRFIDGMKSPNVRRVSIRGNHFVLINSMAFEGDGCFLCRPAEVATYKISKQLKCAKGIKTDCSKSTKNTIERYSRPILLQHFPMYRKSDSLCREPDRAPDEIIDLKFRERWDCISKESSEQLLELLNPRLIVDGHTHHGCKLMHGEDTLEVTIPSYSWRNKNNPSFLMGVFTPDNYALSKCYMPVENTVITIYTIGGILIVFYLLFRIKQKKNRHHHFLKLH